MTKSFTLTVNGKIHTVEADPDMPLLYACATSLASTIRNSAAAAQQAQTLTRPR